MITVISETKRKARKDYICMGCRELLNIDSFENIANMHNMTDSERDVLRVAKFRGFKIRKGDIYIDQTNTDGDIYHFRVIPEIHEICCKYSLYNEDY